MRSNSGFRPIYLWPPLYRTVRVQITRAEQIAYLTAVLVQAGGLTKLFGIWFAPFERVHQIACLLYTSPYAFGMGANGVFMAEPVSNVIGGTLCFVIMLLTILPELKQMER